MTKARKKGGLSPTAISTKPGDVRELFSLHRPERVVIEIGAAEGWVQDLAQAMGLSILDRQGMSWPGGQSGWNNQALAALTHMAQADVRVQQLQSIPGVGPRLAEVVVAVIDDANRFKTAKQVGAYVGLTPKQFESGTMKRQGGTSGRGNKLLRALLVQA